MGGKKCKSFLSPRCRQHSEIFFLNFIPENRIWHFMQIISNGGNLHGMSNLVFWEKNIINLLSAKIVKSEVKIKMSSAAVKVQQVKGYHTC